MLIFVSILLDRGIITPQAFTALLLMAVGNTMLTIPVVAPRWLRLESSRHFRREPDVDAAQRPSTLELAMKEP